MRDIVGYLKSGCPSHITDVSSYLYTNGLHRNYITAGRFTYIVNKMIERRLLIRIDQFLISLEPHYAALGERERMVVILADRIDWHSELLEALT